MMTVTIPPLLAANQELLARHSIRTRYGYGTREIHLVDPWSNHLAFAEPNA